MYMLAAGYDSLSLRVKLCGSSLNSRNFHEANGVYRRPLMLDGFLWYSYHNMSVSPSPTTNGNILTSKYRKNEYMSRYNTMNGANIALRMPMKMKRRRSLMTHLAAIPT